MSSNTSKQQQFFLQFSTLPLKSGRVKKITAHHYWWNATWIISFSGSLELLSLSGNFLRNVPTKALQSMENLLILYLNNNVIDRIREDSFVNFGQNLTDLWLQNNGYSFYEFKILFFTSWMNSKVGCICLRIWRAAVVPWSRDVSKCHLLTNQNDYIVYITYTTTLPRQT